LKKLYANDLSNVKNQYKLREEEVTKLKNRINLLKREHEKMLKAKETIEGKKEKSHHQKL